MIAINKLLVMVFLVAFLCIDISPGLAQSNWQQQQWQQQQRQQRQQEMLRQQQLQQQRMMEQQRQQQQIQKQKQQAQQRQMQQRQIQQQQGSAGLRQNSANRGFPAKNQIQQTPNRPRIVIKTPQSTTNNLKNSTNLSSRAQKAKQTAEDLAYKQKMKDRLFLIKKNKEERRLANLRKAEKERLDKEKDDITNIAKPLYRNMSRDEAEAVKKTGKLRGGNEGDTFFTDSRFKSADKAKDRLSLPNRPEVQMEFHIKNSPTMIRDGTKVDPLFDGRGKGKEYRTTDPVEVEIINVQPYR